MNKYLVVIALIVGAFLAGYFLMPTKVVTEKVEVVKYVKVNSHQVTVTRPDGTTTTTIDTTSDSTTHANSNTITEINVRDTTVIGFIGLGKENKSVGAMLQKDMLSSFGVVVGAQYEIKDKDLIGLVGLSLKW